MELRLDDELTLLDTTASAFCRPVSAARADAEELDEFDRDVVRKMAEMGWTGLAASDPGERLALGVVVEAVGRSGLATPLRESSGSCGALLAALPDPSAAEQISHGVRAGSLVVSLLERGCRGSVRWDVRGGTAVLDAPPSPVDWGQAADWILCVARDAAGARAVVAVDARGPGVTVDPVEAVDDERPAMVGLEEAPGVLLASPSRELDDALPDALAMRMVLRAAELLGGADTLVSMTVEYVKARRQFGRPIGSFQVVRHSCADMATYVEGLRLLVHEALWRSSVGLPFRFNAAAAVLFAARTADFVTTWASQLHGGIGFMADYPLERLLRRVKAAQVRLGTPAALTAWATPLLLEPSRERSPFPTGDVERWREISAVRSLGS